MTELQTTLGFYVLDNGDLVTNHLDIFIDRTMLEECADSPQFLRITGIPPVQKCLVVGHNQLVVLTKSGSVLLFCSEFRQGKLLPVGNVRYIATLREYTFAVDNNSELYLIHYDVDRIRQVEHQEHLDKIINKSLINKVTTIHEFTGVNTMCNIVHDDGCLSVYYYADLLHMDNPHSYITHLGIVGVGGDFLFSVDNVYILYLNDRSEIVIKNVFEVDYTIEDVDGDSTIVYTIDNCGKLRTYDLTQEEIEYEVLAESGYSHFINRYNAVRLDGTVFQLDTMENSKFPFKLLH